MRKMSGGYSAANHRHYCRQCDAVFEPGTEEFAHTTALIHVIRAHDILREFKRCSRYCEEVEQPEEADAGKKLYGVASSRGTSPHTRGYDDLFPKEPEDS